MQLKLKIRPLKNKLRFGATVKYSAVVSTENFINVHMQLLVTHFTVYSGKRPSPIPIVLRQIFIKYSLYSFYDHCTYVDMIARIGSTDFIIIYKSC